jgi:hypothetical protein
MTLEEFKQKIEAVSDRRLLRMLERAQAQNLREAIVLVENERLKRAAAAAEAAVQAANASKSYAPVSAAPQVDLAPTHSSASESGSLEELTSQIRPLEEVLGRHFVKGEVPPKSETLASLPRDREVEEMEPLILKASDWSQFAAPASPKSSQVQAIAVAASPVLPQAPTSEARPVARPAWVDQAFSGPALVEPGPAEPEENDGSEIEPQQMRRGLVIFAIILLLLAGFFAIWRALVG